MSEPEVEWTDKSGWEVIENGIDWSPALRDGDEIVSCEAVSIAGEGLTISRETQFEGTVQSVRVAGGAPGIHRIRCRAPTASGEKLEQLAVFRVR